MATKFYDFRKVDCVLNGFNLGGYQEGEGISIEWPEDLFEVTPGIDGESVVSRVASANADATISLMSSSKSNDYLSALFNAARKTDVSAAAFSFLLKDRNTSTLIATANAVIKRPANVSYDSKPTAREWELKLIDTEVFVGGSDG